MSLITNSVQNTKNSQLNGGLFNWIWLLTMLVAIGAVVHFYEIEVQLGIVKWYPLLVGGFLLHAITPLAHRLKVFSSLTVVGAFVLFGWKDGGIMLAVFSIVFGVTELPIKYNYKRYLIIFITVVFAAMKAGYLPDFVP